MSTSFSEGHNLKTVQLMMLLFTSSKKHFMVASTSHIELWASSNSYEDMKADPTCRYERFKFSYADSIQEAYEKECQNYHDFGGEEGYLRNKEHPAKPDRYEGTCPICGRRCNASKLLCSMRELSY